MIAQAATLFFDLSIYVAAVIILVLAIGVVFYLNDYRLSLLGVLTFLFTIELIYPVFTHFAVLPFGDDYGQFGIASYIIQHGHLSILSQPPIVTLGINTYSQWPGFEFAASSFSLITGISLIQVGVAFPFALYALWILGSFILISRFLTKESSYTLVVLALAGSFTFTEIPLHFKYDFLALDLLIILVILLLDYLKNSKSPNIVCMILIGAGLVIIHSYTAFVWLVTLFLVTIAVFLGSIHQFSRLHAYLGVKRNCGRLGPLSLLIFSATLAWWVFIGFAVWVAEANPILSPGTLFRITFAFANPQGFFDPYLSAATIPWILSLLHLRNYAFLALIFAGTITLILRPRAVSNKEEYLVLLIILLEIFLGTIFPVLGNNGRISTLLSVVVAIPVLSPFIFLRNTRLGRFFAIGVTVFFMFTISLGYWGNSYAPTYLYTPGVSSASFGEHPVFYGAASGFLESSETNSCVFTNEAYVTSLMFPIEDWYNLHLVGTEPIGPDCIVIVYNQLDTFNTSYITEGGTSYHGFSYIALGRQLVYNFDSVFSATVPVRIYISPR